VLAGLLLLLLLRVLAGYLLLLLGRQRARMQQRY
jgi:hypothetical protein